MDYRDMLKFKIILMITNDLTIGRKDNGLNAFTSDKIDKFIKQNNHKIEDVITDIIHDYSEDNELELLKEPYLDRIGEYLYESINTIWCEN
jgi:hypothetical protein